MVLPDYFAFYGLEESFHPDASAVRKQYYAQSRRYHPDLVASGDDAALKIALTMSALNNEAYVTLGDAYRTMGYILKLHQVIEEEEAYKLPADFLMEMMELNEAVGNAAMAPDMKNDAVREYTAAVESWDKAVQPLMQRFESGDRSPELFALLKDYYYRKKYLLRIKERLV